jgi:hypothetical protein
MFGASLAGADRDKAYDSSAGYTALRQAARFKPYNPPAGSFSPTQVLLDLR